MHNNIIPWITPSLSDYTNNRNLFIVSTQLVVQHFFRSIRNKHQSSSVDSLQTGARTWKMFLYPRVTIQSYDVHSNLQSGVAFAVWFTWWNPESTLWNSVVASLIRPYHRVSKIHEIPFVQLQQCTDICLWKGKVRVGYALFIALWNVVNWNPVEFLHHERCVSPNGLEFSNEVKLYLTRIAFQILWFPMFVHFMEFILRPWYDIFHKFLECDASRFVSRFGPDSFYCVIDCFRENISIIVKKLCFERRY